MTFIVIILNFFFEKKLNIRPLLRSYFCFSPESFLLSSAPRTKAGSIYTRRRSGKFLRLWPAIFIRQKLSVFRKFPALPENSPRARLLIELHSSFHRGDKNVLFSSSSTQRDFCGFNTKKKKKKPHCLRRRILLGYFSLGT